MEGISYWIHKRASMTPTRTAIITEDKQFTYKEYSEEIHHFAALLQNHFHLKKGDRVAILSHNREEFLTAYFAIAQLGLIAVPLNIRLTASELAFQVNDSGARIILYEAETAEIFEELKYHVKFESAYSFDEEEPIVKRDVHVPEINSKEDPFIICYTSGTTGKPKGAVLTQENMFWNAVNNHWAIDITTKDIVSVLLPLFHIGGIGLFAFPALLAGGTVLIPRKFEPDNTIKMVEDYRVTIIMGVPTIHDSLRKSPLFEKANFESVRWFYSGGAPCPNELINYFLDRGLPFGQGMGMTETSPTIFMLSEEDYKRKVGSIGKPVMFCDIKLIDDDGNEVEKGEIGELLIKGPHVMKEYWGLPEKTNEAIKDGWFYSGDLMRQDEEGFIYVAGRKKDMIISGGENIYPLEIEGVINEIPKINEVAVIGIKDDKWGEVPVAFISLNQNESIEEEEVKTYVKQKLAKYKVPKRVIKMDNLPKNATGKLDKKELNNYSFAR